MTLLSLTNISCFKSVHISEQGIYVLDLIFLAAKNPLVKAFLCVYLCVCVCMHVHCSECFLLAFLTGSWCWVQLRTRKRPFLSSVNHFRRREKKWRGGGSIQALHWFSPLQSGLLIPFLSPSFYTCSSISALFSLSLVLFLEIPPWQWYCGGKLRVYWEFTSCVRILAWKINEAR